MSFEFRSGNVPALQPTTEYATTLAALAAILGSEAAAEARPTHVQAWPLTAYGLLFVGDIGTRNHPATRLFVQGQGGDSIEVTKFDELLGLKNNGLLRTN